VTDNENRTAEETIAEAIDGAEEIRDPLEDLVEKTKLDSSAPFMPEALERLAALKRDDCADLREAARTAKEGRLPGDGARQGAGRGKR